MHDGSRAPATSTRLPSPANRRPQQSIIAPSLSGRPRAQGSLEGDKGTDQGILWAGTGSPRASEFVGRLAAPARLFWIRASSAGKGRYSVSKKEAHGKPPSVEIMKIAPWAGLVSVEPTLRRRAARWGHDGNCYCSSHHMPNLDNVDTGRHAAFNDSNTTEHSVPVRLCNFTSSNNNRRDQVRPRLWGAGREVLRPV